MAHSRHFITGAEGLPQASAHPLAAAFARLGNVPSRRPWFAYATAVIATALATVARWLLGSILGPNMHPFVTYYPMVMFAALFGGTGPGLLTTIISAFAVPYLFLAPPGIAVAHPADQVGLVLFVAINVAVSFVCGALRSARHRSFSEARRAEASEERFRLFMDHTPTLAWVKDDQGRYTYINRAYEQRFGHTSAECRGKTDADLWPPDVAARLQEADQAALTAGRPIQLTEETTHPDGTVSFWLNTKFPIRDAAGRQFIASIGLDVTERRRAEAELRASEERLRKAISTPTVGVLFFDLSSRIHEANEAFQRLSGYSAEELRSLDWKVLTAPECLDLTLQHVAELADRGETAPYEKVMLRKDGSRWWGLFAPTRLSGSGAHSNCMEFVIDITDRKHFQEAMQESEARLRLAVETDELGMYERDLLTNKVTLNPACQALLGAAEPFPPDLARRSLHPEDRERVLAEVARAFDPNLGAICAAEFRIVRPDGSVRWVAGRGRVLFDDTAHPPQPVRFIGVLNDITARKHAEEALRLSEEHYRLTGEELQAIMDATPIALFVAHDPRCQLITGNHRAHELLGVDPAEKNLSATPSAQGAPPYFRVHRKGHETGGAELPMQVAAANGVVVRNQELEVLRRDGTRRTMLVTAAPLFAPNGQPRGAVGAAVDITDRKQAEDALRQSEERFSAFMRHLPGATWMKDAAGRYVYANPEAERIFSKSLHVLRGKTDEELFPPETARQFRVNDLRALAEGGKLQTTEVLRQADGLDHHSIISKFAVLGPDGRPAYVGGVAFDITDRIRAEEALRQTKDALARANADLEKKVQLRTAKLGETVAELEHFSYTITHDMRAPLRAMTGYAGILSSLHAQSLSDQGRDLLRRISEAALRMDHLITDALQYSRVMRDRVELHPLDPAAAIRGIVESYPHFQPPHAHITLQPEMPRVLATQAGLTQIFSNLLGNGVKFVTPGQVPQITVTAEILTRPPAGDDPASGQSAEWVRFYVADNGVGIPSEYHDKIWEMFQRLSKHYEGTGIGLALVRKVVERMGGRVGLESAPGQGSRFWVELQKAPDTPKTS